MSKKNLLDPAYNDLIPGGPMPEPPELSPDYANLHPSGPPNELCPGYVAPKPDAEEAPRGCGRIQVDLGNGLSASSCPSGGLSVFKNGRQLYSTEDLSAEDKKTIADFREKFSE